MPRTAATTLAALGGTLLTNEFYKARDYLAQRARKRFYNNVFGMPTYSSNRRASTTLRMGRYSGRRRILSRKRKARSSTTARRTRKKRYRRVMGTTGPAARTRLKWTKYRSDLGQRIGLKTARKAYLKNSSVISNVQDKRLAAHRLIHINYNDDDTLMNCRNGRLADVHGVKFRCWFELFRTLPTNAAYNYPIQVRWAIINPKENTGELTDVTNGTNFFESPGPGADDSIDFPSTGRAMAYMNRRINRRRYGVLQEGTFLLSNLQSSTDNRMSMQSKKFFSVYVPIKLQMKWANNDNAAEEDGYPNANIQFVYWYCYQGDQEDAQQLPAGAIRFSYEKITWFNNSEILT